MLLVCKCQETPLVAQSSGSWAHAWMDEEAMLKLFNFGGGGGGGSNLGTLKLDK